MLKKLLPISNYNVSIDGLAPGIFGFQLSSAQLVWLFVSISIKLELCLNIAVTFLELAYLCFNLKNFFS
ncbi:MAG: hypothetical protein CMO75_08220 [Verrucomicrobiales bacterium]|nr:hypothetical protein [Verrucomicrobiales bacterium]